MSPAQAAALERQLDQLVGQRASALATTTHRVPVYFHVIRTGKGKTGDVSRTRIDDQISVMNSAYGKSETGFSFYLKGRDWTTNTAWLKAPDTYEKQIKSKLRKGDAGTLNVYTASLQDGLLGWATFPWQYKGDPAMDGVMVHYGSLPGGSITHYNVGQSATHETGHWLGLYHTFEGGCTSPGDYVSDTPYESEPAYKCPTSRDTCTAAGKDTVHNYMDYSYDTCMTQFSKGQASRMQKEWAAYR
ncbi:MAG: metalloprotease [Actinoallomurus sp.]|nr:metalloprotease [Actinoallomurus sp.]